MSNKIIKFAQKLIDFAKVSGEEEIFDTLISAIEKKLHEDGLNESDAVVSKIRSLVEQHYGLSKTDLNNSFYIKDRKLTEPKFMWVIITVKIFSGDRQKAKTYIGNGCKNQKVYSCIKQFDALENFYTIDKANQIRISYKTILESYE